MSATVLLGGCDDRSDRAPSEPLSFQVKGTLCGDEVSYEAPEGSALTLVTSPSGLLQALVVADGPLFNVNDPDARQAYAETHDVFAVIVLEEPTELQTGSVSWVSSAELMARGFGTSELGSIEMRNLEVTEYQPNALIAGNLTDSIDWFTEGYPDRASDECMDGQLSLEFRGSFVTWDGQANCYSPTQNLDRLATDFVAGCSCDARQDKAQCVTICDDPSQASGAEASCDGMAIALFCVDDQWIWGYDGPCRTSN